MKILTLFLVLLVSTVGFAQDITVQGSVLDGDFDMEPLAFAHVKVKGLDIKTDTKLDGAFSINLLEGKYSFIVEFVGYEPVQIDNVNVSGKEVVLSPIVLSARKPNNDMALIVNGQLKR